MKVKPITQPTKFTPVTVEITFESQDEINSLWNRLNISNEGYEGEFSNKIINTIYEDDLNLELFTLLSRYHTEDDIGGSNGQHTNN